MMVSIIAIGRLEGGHLRVNSELMLVRAPIDKEKLENFGSFLQVVLIDKGGLASLPNRNLRPAKGGDRYSMD